MKAQLNKNDPDSEDFMTFETNGVKFKIVGVEERNRKFFYTVKNVAKKTYSVLTYDYMRGVIKDF